MYMTGHAVLCQGEHNTNHRSLKQKEKSKSMQTNDVALISEVGEGLRETFLRCS